MVWWNPGTWIKIEPSKTTTTTPVTNTGTTSTPSKTEPSKSGGSVSTPGVVQTPTGRVSTAFPERYTSTTPTTNPLVPTNSNPLIQPIRRGGGGSTEYNGVVQTPTGRVSTAFPERYTSTTPTTTPPPITPTSNTITPKKPTGVISAAPNTNTPINRATQTIGGATSALLSNLNPLNPSNTYGVIGKQGFSEWSKKSIYSPFEYVGTPTAYKTIGTNINPKWRGTTYGYGLPNDKKDYYTPEGFRDTTKKTYYDYKDTLQQNNLFEPPTYKYINAVETGTVIATSSYGGSLVTVGTSVYTGIRTAGNYVNYKTNYGQLSTTQKVLGGAGIVAGAAFTLYGANLGVSKFNNEWRNIIYTDLANQPAKIRGIEAINNKDSTSYIITATRKQGTSSAFTGERLTVYPTGEDRLGYFAKGTTKTSIYDPGTMKQVITTEGFTSVGKVTNIQGTLIKGGKGYQGVTNDYSSGLGQGIYKTNNNLKSYSFVSGSKDAGSKYIVTSTKSVYSPDLSKNVPQETLNRLDPIYRGKIDSFGYVKKIQGTSTDYSLSSGFTKTKLTFNSPGALASASLDKTQSFGITSIAKKSSFDLGTTLINTPTTKQNYKTSSAFNIQDSTQQTNKPTQNIITIPKETPTTKTDTANKNKNIGFVSTSSRGSSSSYQVPKVVQTPINNQPQIVIPQISTPTKQKQKTGTPITSITTTPFNPISNISDTPKPVGNFNFKLGVDNDIFGFSKTGGKRQTAYIPSFTALAFGKTGTYKKTRLSQSGLDYRPITKKFKISKGGLKLRL